jgi:hypothetical protein
LKSLIAMLILHDVQITTQGNLITLSNAQLANRINLHLALGGNFDSTPP